MYFDPKRSKLILSIPSEFSTLSKGKIGHAKILLASAIREFINAGNVYKWDIAFNSENQKIFLPLDPTGNVKTGAVQLLELARASAGNVAETQSKHSDILIVDHKFVQGQPILVIIKINDSITEVSVDYPEYMAELVSKVIPAALCFESNPYHNQSQEIQEILTGITQVSDQRFQIFQRQVNKAWNELFPNPVDLNLSYFANGGDSIQAIRFLSKLKSMGFDGDFASLLTAPSMNLWGIVENQSSSIAMPEQSSYALSAMQQRIWNQQHAADHPLYHEQFLFELKQCPDFETIKVAYQKIWNAYPQLRVSIQNQEGTWIQQIESWEPDFRTPIELLSTEAWLTQDLQEGFPKQLMRCQIGKINNQVYLLWSHHHVLLDGWSVGLLIEQFISLIESNAELSIQPNYQAIVVQKEQEILQNPPPNWGDFFKKHQVQQFKKTIPTQKPFEEISEYFVIPNFDEFCRQENLTPQQVFLAALSLVNFSINGTSDAYIHSISSGRSLIPEFAEEAIGLMIKNILIGWSWNANDSFREVTQNVIHSLNESLAREHYFPGNSAETEMEIPDVLFVYENYPYQEVNGSKIQGKLVYNLERTGYPITLLVMPKGEGFTLKIIYHSGMFSDAFVDHLKNQLLSTAKSFTKGLDQKIIAPENKIKKSQIAAYPHWINTVDHNLSCHKPITIRNNNNECLSDLEIINLTEQVKQVLLPFQVGSRIALFGEMNQYTPALIFSIMRNGFTYVPLNPSWPKERIEQVLAIAECKAILYPSDQVQEFSMQNIALSAILSSTPLTLTEPPRIDQEAYILFTSGSTGIPKGVQLSHRNLSSFLDACLQQSDLNTFKHIFSLTNLGFDLSLFENLFGLYSGKEILVIADLSYLESAISLNPKGLLNTVPSVLSRLQEGEIKNLSVVHSAGEPFHESLWNHLKVANPELIIKNWYGPTETTTYSSVMDLSDAYTASIGVALSHENIDILDARLTSLPYEIEGEIVISGDGVALGYLNADGGFYEHQGVRYYRTGDVGYKIAGKFYLKGRSDRQVKRLGQRFELGEIEQAIHARFNNIKRLVYLVHSQHFLLFIEQEPNHELEDFLHQRFPKYMCPDQIIFITQFPENNNGKVKHSALIDYFLSLSPSTNERENGNHELLEKLRNITIFETLNGKYGFIEQGGDSILGLRLVGKLKTWGYKAEIHDLLNAPTLLDFLQSLNKSSSDEIARDSLALTPIQHWFLEHYQGNKNHFNQSILLEIHIPLPVEQLRELTQETIAAFPLLHEVYNGTWIGGKSPTINLYTELNADEIPAYCEKIQRGFNLNEGPVAGGAIFSANHQNYLFLCIHHLYCDGFTWRIVLDELKNRLQGQGMKYGASEVFAKVQHQLKNYIQKEPVPSIHLNNPFDALSPASYRQSAYLEILWESEKTELFLRSWNSQVSVNEKILFLVLGTWQRLNHGAVTPILETHGRSYEGIHELSESIGWFTQFYPVPLDWSQTGTNLMREIERAYEIATKIQLRYMGDPNWKKPPYPLLINFLGNFDENWGGIAQPSTLSQGSMVDENNFMMSIVEINALIIEGKIKWMLRSHPEFDLNGFAHEFEKFSNLGMLEVGDNTYIDASIDEDDREAIDDLLSEL